MLGRGAFPAGAWAHETSTIDVSNSLHCRVFSARASLLMLALLLTSLPAAPVLCAEAKVAGALSPCDHESDDYHQQVDRLIDVPARGHINVSFTAFPSFDTEWGIRVVEKDGRYFLRSVRFRNSVWHSAYAEYKPHYFHRNPAKADTRRVVHEVPLSADVAALLQESIRRELTELPMAEPQMGLDGESYLFRDDAARCGTTWSPDLGTRAFNLVEAFEALRIQAALPLRPIQYVKERRAYQLLLSLKGSSMHTKDYLMLIGAMLSVVLLASLPMVTASLTLLAPRRPLRKRKFVLASGVLTYGITCVAGVVVLPFILFGWQLGTFLPSLGSPGLGTIFDGLYLWSPIALAVLWVVLSFAVPIYLRLRGWARFVPQSSAPTAAA